MSEQRELTQDHRTEYERMTAEELSAVLRRDLEAEKGSGLDDETLLYVIQLYARKQPVRLPKTAAEAFAEFRRDYLFHRKEAEAIADESEMHRRKTKRWRYATTAAAVVTLVLCAGLCVRAGVFKGGQPVYRQNRDSLSVIGNYGEGTQGNARQVAQRCFPQWLPEGYERVQTRWSDEFCAAVYYRGDPAEEDCLTVTFRAFGPGQRLQFFKNPEPAKAFSHCGVQFYLYHNAQWTGAVGCTDGVLISISAKASEEELIQIVQSMSIQ